MSLKLLCICLVVIRNYMATNKTSIILSDVSIEGDAKRDDAAAFAVPTK